MHHNLDDSSHWALMRDFVKGQIGGDGDGKEIYKPIQASQVTRVGRILRKTGLDELPQLFNVLRGAYHLLSPEVLSTC
jgi:lipopolysaccharide/colanic/teichoic acid biosynthesis glycosyltransferase